MKTLITVLDSVPLVNLPNAYVMKQVIKVKEQLLLGISIMGEREAEYGAKDILCSEQFGVPWRPLVSRTREASQRLNLELKGIRPEDDNW